MLCTPYRSSSQKPSHPLRRWKRPLFPTAGCSPLVSPWIDVGRYISLERVFEQTRESYYDTLERCSRGWHKGEHDALRAGKGAKAERIRNAVERKLGPFRTADIEAESSGVSHEWVRRSLRELRDWGSDPVSRAWTRSPLGQETATRGC